MCRVVELVRRVPCRVRAWSLLAVAAVFAGQGLSQVLTGWHVVGIDFEPLRHAAQSLARGESVYGDALFVYPPTAAVVLLPTVLGPAHVAFTWWVVVCAAAMLLAGWLVCRCAEPGRRPYVLAVAVLGLFGGVVASRSLFLGNLSELLVPVAVGVLLAFQRGRWVPGCAVLAASLLVKPLLAPLVLVAVLHRRWGALGRTMVPAGLLLLLSMLLVPGGPDYPAVLRYCLSGTNLHGAYAANNLSLRGWAEGQHAPRLLGVLAAGVVGVLVVAGIARVRRRGGCPAPVWLGNVLLLGTLLAGGISETHFLLTVLATTLLQLAVQESPARTWALFVPGIALFCLPDPYVVLAVGAGAADRQNWLVAGELLLLAALLAAPARSAVAQPQSQARSAPSATPVPAAG